MTVRSLVAAFALVMAPALMLAPSIARSAEPAVYYFGSTGCDYCATGHAFLTRWKAADSRVTIREFDIVSSSDDATSFVTVVAAIGLADPRVPMTIVGHHVFIGYEGDDSTGEEIKLAVEQCRAKDCPDIVKGLLTLGAQVVTAPQGWVVNQRFAKAAIAK